MNCSTMFETKVGGNLMLDIQQMAENYKRLAIRYGIRQVLST